jgi:hypothetical protein
VVATGEAKVEEVVSGVADVKQFTPVTQYVAVADVKQFTPVTQYVAPSASVALAVSNVNNVRCCNVLLMLKELWKSRFITMDRPS